MEVQNRNNVQVVGRDGDAPTVLLAHGFGCDQNMWRLVVPHLTPHFRVVLFDYVGAGRSDHSAWSAERYGSLSGYAQDVRDICHDLALGPVVYVGHSVSSMIGVLAAIAEPDLFDSLVLLTPSPCYIDDGDYRGGFSRADIDELLGTLDANYLGWSATMAPVIMGNPDRPELGDELTNSFCRTDPTIARTFAHATFLSDNRDDLRRVTLPTLVIQSGQDAIAPPEVGAYVRDQIPNSDLVTLSSTGHCPQLSDPDQVAAAILSFVHAPA
ncbi:MAG TPA: alpha/beta hydrolase [Micromonosporaceae bacterium]